MSQPVVYQPAPWSPSGPESEGSGLGLAIARDLVEAQGGHIELHSEVDAGTTVRVRLDAAEADG